MSNDITRKGVHWALLADTDDYSDLNFTSAEAEQISRKIAQLSIGPTLALPLKCWPSRCPFASVCVFHSIGKAPGNGRTCLVEMNLVREWTMNLVEEYGVSQEDITDRFLLQELVEHQLTVYRINSNLSLPENADLVEETAIGQTREGDPITRKEILALMELKLKIQKRIDTIIKRMVGDRQEKYKKASALKTRDNADLSSSLASAAKELEVMTRELRRTNNTEELSQDEDIIDSILDEE